MDRIQQKKTASSLLTALTEYSHYSRATTARKVRLGKDFDYLPEKNEHPLTDTTIVGVQYREYIRSDLNLKWKEELARMIDILRGNKSATINDDESFPKLILTVLENDRKIEQRRMELIATEAVYRAVDFRNYGKRNNLTINKLRFTSLMKPRFLLALIYQQLAILVVKATRDKEHNVTTIEDQENVMSRILTLVAFHRMVNGAKSIAFSLPKEGGMMFHWVYTIIYRVMKGD